MERQTLTLRYIDKSVIARTLTEIYQGRYFEVDVRDDEHAVLTVPWKLSQSQIEKLQEDLDNARN
jgi:phage-related protein